MEPKVLVLIPAYNESRRIGGVIGDIRKTLPDADIVVVDDGSRDDTANRAIQVGARVVSHPFNMGYGVAIQTGYKYAHMHGYDRLVQIDGDGQHDPAYIPDLLSPIDRGEADFVIGSRFLSAESYEPSLSRRLAMGFFRKLVSLVVRQPMTDSTSGFQAFNGSVIRFFTRDIFPCDYPDADMLITLHRAGFRMAEVPVRMFANQDGVSMHSGLKPFYYVFKMVLSIGVVLLRSKRFYGARMK